jgi:hypothetical protein
VEAVEHYHLLPISCIHWRQVPVSSCKSNLFDSQPHSTLTHVHLFAPLLINERAALNLDNIEISLQNMLFINTLVPKGVAATLRMQLSPSCGFYARTLSLVLLEDGPHASSSWVSRFASSLRTRHTVPSRHQSAARALSAALPCSLDRNVLHPS